MKILGSPVNADSPQSNRQDSRHVIRGEAHQPESGAMASRQAWCDVQSRIWQGLSRYYEGLEPCREIKSKDVFSLVYRTRPTEAIWLLTVGGPRLFWPRDNGELLHHSSSPSSGSRHIAIMPGVTDTRKSVLITG